MVDFCFETYTSNKRVPRAVLKIAHSIGLMPTLAQSQTVFSESLAASLRKRKDIRVHDIDLTAWTITQAMMGVIRDARLAGRAEALAGRAARGAGRALRRAPPQVTGHLPTTRLHTASRSDSAASDGGDGASRSPVATTSRRHAALSSAEAAAARPMRPILVVHRLHRLLHLREAVHRLSVEDHLPGLAPRGASQNEHLARTPRAPLEVEPHAVPAEREPCVRGDRPDLRIDREREGIEARRAVLDLAERERSGLELETGMIEEDLLPDAPRLVRVTAAQVEVARRSEE